MAEWLGLARVAAVPPDGGRVVALRGAQALTHADFVAAVRGWQAAFAAHGGARFALFFDDAFDFACALFGCWHAGKEAVLPGDAQPATLARLLPQVDGCAGELPGTLKPVAAAGSGPAAAAAGAASAAGPAGAAPTGDIAPASIAPLDLQRASLVIFTSGSSGQPLAIAKRLAQMEAEILHLEQAFGARLAVPGLALHATVSHQHIYGLLFITLWPLAAGRPVALERLAYPEQMAARLAAGPAALVSSPAHLRRLPEGVDWAPAKERLQAIFSSGGPLPPESATEALALLGQSPIEVYGSSETGGVAWRQRALHGDRWTPLPEVQWQLREDTLCVRSSHLGDDDWWETSDRARALEDGGFVLMGRADRIVKIEEKRVSLVALEQALLATGDIAEARGLLVPAEGGPRLGVVAVPSERGWQALRADGKRRFTERLRAALLQVVERVALPRRFRFVRELPVNTQGKATEALLQALFLPLLPEIRWREQGPQRAVAELAVVPELRVLDGHFPGVSVLPGVAQLDWAIVLARRCFALPPRMLRAEQLKFHAPVLPPATLELALDWQAELGRLEFRYSSATGPHSGGRLVFGTGDA